MAGEADPNKTVTVSIDLNGNIQVDITATDGYPERPEITITKQEDKSFRLTKQDMTGSLIKNRVSPRFPPLKATADGLIEKLTARLKAGGTVPGTYTVTVVCTGVTFTGTVTVPPNGKGFAELALDPNAKLPA